MYQSGPGYYRVASKPAPEARMWMIDGIAGGIQPWWHYVAAYHEDRRMYNTPGPVMRWHKQNEQYLLNRTPVASVGLVWSQRSTDFYGRRDSLSEDDVRDLCSHSLWSHRAGSAVDFQASDVSSSTRRLEGSE